MSEEEINEALKIIKEPITVNSIEYKCFNQENYEKLLSVYENAKWFVSNWEQALQNIKDLQQKVEQLEKDKSYANWYAVKKEKEVEQLENIRKEAIEYINHATIGADSSPIEDSWLYNLYETRYILNKGSDKNGNNTNETSTGETEK